MRFAIRSLLALAAMALAGCASLGGGAPGPAEDPLLVQVPDLEQRALLLLMADQRRFEPLIVETSMRGDAGLRRQLAVSLGRAGDGRGASYLAELLADGDVEVRRSAAFALGELHLERDEAERAARSLLLSAVDDDPDTGRLAVEALGKLGVSVSEVMKALAASPLAEAQRWRRLLPSLYRFDEPSLVAVAEAGLAAVDAGAEPPARRAELHRWAAFALSRTPRPESLPRLRALLADPDPRVRAWAARALSIVGEAPDLARLLPLATGEAEGEGSAVAIVGGEPGEGGAAVAASEDAGAGAGAGDGAGGDEGIDPAPRVQAVRAAAALVERLAAPASGGGGIDPELLRPWPAVLAGLLDQADAHLRLEALDRAAPFLAGTGVAGAQGADVRRLRAALLRRAEAAVALAEGKSPAKERDAGGAGSGSAAGPGSTPGMATAAGAMDPGVGGETGLGETGLGETGLGETLPGDLRPGESALGLPATGLESSTGERVAEGSAALGALASASGAAAVDPAASGDVAALVQRAAASPAPLLRAAAATAAADLATPSSPRLLEGLLGDREPAVRSAAASALLSLADRFSPVAANPGGEGGAAPRFDPLAVATRLLASPDLGVRAVAFSWLADHPVVPYTALTRALQASLAGDNVETLLAAVPALAARGAAEAAERGGVVTVLENLAGRRATSDTAWLLRRAAADTLVSLDRPRPPVGHPRGRVSPDVYELIVQRTSEPREVEMVTTAGTLRLRLDCPAAPLTCLNFLQLASQGAFDGVPFHRLVPDFVAQGGDPRGDGLGGPGYAIRDEINRRRFTTGTLGMALSGADTGGSQFFLTLSPQPHLDGHYTAFGEVVAGTGVLARITRGSRIERVQPLP